MTMHALPDEARDIPSPVRFTYPFCYTPHPLCVAAAAAVRAYVKGRPEWADELSRGKMLGVLVVRRGTERGFLAAFSGTLDGRTRHGYFVPPVYDLMDPGGYFEREQAAVSELNARVDALQRRFSDVQERREAEQELAQARARMLAAKAGRDRLRATLPPGELQDRLPDLVRESQHQKAEYRRLQKAWQERIDRAEAPNREIRHEVALLEEERRRRSAALQEWLFARYVFLNARGERRDAMEIFAPDRPPGGTGDCCAPKLLQAAFTSGMVPLCMAEFWVGRSPADEIRADGQFYPSCRSKCLPILSYMMQGLLVDPNPLAEVQAQLERQVKEVYRCADFVVLNKPSGLLSVPGKEAVPSLKDYVRKHYPEATGPLMVHRLDMDTSGLMVVALHEAVYRHLQHLFLHRQVEKTYLALLQHPLPVGAEGRIALPLAPDIDDRPRQRVDETHGREAVTDYRVLDCVDGHALVALVPHTGRTHQLRVHCAHSRGLDNPIVGDRLYGTHSDRLMLHAARLAFDGHEFMDLLGLGNYNLSSL